MGFKVKKYPKDWSGTKQGRLTVFKKIGSKPLGKQGLTTDLWEAICDCGKLKTISTQALKAGQKSCGCLLQEFRKNELPKITALRNTKSKAGFNSVYGSYFQRANKKGISFALSEGQFASILKQNCTYCGRPPSNRYEYGKHIDKVFIWQGIDRLDNSKGYEVGNCLPCCAICNKARRAMSVDDFRAWIIDLTLFQYNKFIVPILLEQTGESV